MQTMHLLPNRKQQRRRRHTLQSCWRQAVVCTEYVSPLPVHYLPSLIYLILTSTVSGGGGWGLKQGLLSLDPQMSHPAAASLSSVESGSDSSQSHRNKILGEERRDEEMDDEAMLSFIRSFKNETLVGRQVSEAEAAAGEASEESGVDGVAMPGAYVQFFVAPLQEQTVPKDVTSNADAGPEAWSIALGAQAGYDGNPPILDNSATASEGKVALIHNHFGAVSNHGIFLSAVARGRVESSENSGAPSTRTKLDAPNAYVWGSMHPR